MSRDIYSPHKRRSSLSSPAMAVLLLIIVIFIVGIIFFINGKFGEAKNLEDKSDIYFAIKSGDGVGEIAKNLEKQGLINKKIYFNTSFKNHCKS